VHPRAFPYQAVGAEWLAPLPNAYLADGMGVGKTAQSIWGCDIAGHRNILVICPGIARVNWQREFEEWQQIPRTLGLVVDTRNVPDTDVVISSYHTLAHRPVLTKLLSRSWDKIIIDEAHYLKNSEAQRTKIIFGANCDGTKGLASRAAGFWLLSGTPFPNGPHEAWTVARALFPSAVKGLEDYADWMSHFCETEATNFGIRVVATRNIPEFVTRLRPFVKRRLLEDVQPDLPPYRFGHVVVSPSVLPPLPEDVSPEVIAVIEAAKAKFMNSEADFMTGDQADATAWVSSAQLSSLRRWTGLAKAPAVAEALCEDLANGLTKVVVFAVHRDVIDILRRKIPGSVVINGSTPEKTRQALIDDFQGRMGRVGPRVLICNIDIASTALTLTASADVAFAETTWVPKDVLQGLHRCWRIGQTRPVLARVFSLRGSLDEAVSATLVRKSNMVSRLEAGLATG